MAYTQAQLVAAYTAANDGVAPDAATTTLLGAFATQTSTGQLSDAAALAYVINSADKTTAVAVEAYQFFTGKTPSKAGLDFLVNSTANATDLNDPYYTAFNIENRYMNFAANLGIVGEGATTFNTTYGTTAIPVWSTFVGVIYEQIIGSSYAVAAGINVTAALNDVIGRQAAFTQIARERGIITSTSTQAQIDIATRAVAVGYLLVEGIKADVGVYAAGANNFTNALVNGNAQYNVNLLTTYSVLGGGTGSPVPGGATGGTSFNLTTGVDNLIGTAANDTFNGVFYTDSAAATGLVTTFSSADTINGGGGSDTLNLTVTKSDGTTIGGAQAFPAASLNSVEIINVRVLGVAGDSYAVNAALFNDELQVNSDRSVAGMVITNLATGAAAGIIGNGAGGNGALSFGYQTATAAATLNLTGGVLLTASPPAGPAVAITTAAPSVTVNSLGQASNRIGTFALGGSATALTINATAGFSTASGAAITGWAAGTTNTITVNGSVTSTSTTSAAVNIGTADASVNTINAAGLTGAAGVGVTVGANLGVNFTGGAGLDVVTINGTITTLAGSLSGSINGAGGTDIIAFTASGDLTTTNASKITGFETLRVSNTLSPGVGALGGFDTTQTFDPTLISGITAYQVGQSNGGVTLINLPAAPSISIIGNVGNAIGADNDTATAGTTPTTTSTGLTVQLKDASGTADAVTVTLNNGNTLGTLGTGGVNVNSLSLGGNATAGQIETLNLVSAGTITANTNTNGAVVADKNTTVYNTYNTVNLAASGVGPNFADPNTVKVTGSQGLTLTTGTLAHSILVDASTATGGLNFTAGAGAFAVSVNGTTANDTITVTAAAQSGIIYGGGGGDSIVITGNTAINTILYKVGADSLLDLSGTATAPAIAAGQVGASLNATANTGKMDVITGFVAGTDKLSLIDLGTGFATGVAIAEKGTVVDAAGINTLLATATFFQDSTTTVRKIAQFHDGNGATYVVADVNGNGTFDAGSDLVVKLLGVASISTTDLV